MSKELKRIICIVPCYNEEGSLLELVRVFDLVRQNNKAKFSLDLMLINDGSSDNTQTLIESLSANKDYIFYRNFASNSGHQSALRAGLDVASNYDAAVMMDADLQHPPHYIEDMVKEWQSNKALIVQMVRNDSHRDVGLFKYFSSRTYYWLINQLSGLGLEYGSSDFRLVDSSVIKTIASSPEKDLFLRGYFTWLGVKRSSLSYKPAKRFAGTSKYTLRKMLAFARRGILQFSEKPLRLATDLGLLFAVLSFIYGLYVFISYLAGGESVSGWTSLMIVMLFCFGLNFVLIGFVGRYLAHSIEIQKQRPDYIVASEKLPK